MSTQTHPTSAEVATAPETKTVQLYISYGHIDPYRLPLLCHVESGWTPVDRIDPQKHADEAPRKEEWFQYYVRSETGIGYVRIGATYVMDAALVENFLSTIFRLPGIGLRRCKAVWGYYAPESGVVMISTSGS